MAFLLLLHEKMRLRRKVNKLTLKQLTTNSRLDRMTKNIERVQKMYSSRQSRLQKETQLLTTQFKNSIMNSMGLGAQNQAFNPYMGGGLTTFVLNQMGEALASGKLQKDKDNTYPEILGPRFQEMLNDYYSYGLKLAPDEYNPDKTNDPKYGATGQFSKDEYNAFQIAMRVAQQNQTMAQSYAQQMSSNYETNVSIWLQAQETQMEEEQQAALLPLEMEQTELELEKDSIETQLEKAREDLKNIESACKEEMQNSSPKFGLG